MNFALLLARWIIFNFGFIRYGIRAIDTSVYYGSSETVLGNILHSLRDEFPRSSYQLVNLLFLHTSFVINSLSLSQITKCGRYGLASFDYSPVTIRKTVIQSLERLRTDYLDAVFLHDVEFVCTPIAPRAIGNHVSSLKEDAAAYGLANGDETCVRGEGDQKILDAYHELQALQREGLVRNIGITGILYLACLRFALTVFSGYPLPMLLRLAILILYTPPYKPVDVLLSYSHLCLQNSTFLEFIPHFYERAKVGQLLAASPLSMGLLTPKPPPWHPAPPELRKAVVDASLTWAGDFPNLAVGYSMRHITKVEKQIALVIGLSTPREVHEAVKVWREVVAGSEDEERRKGEVLAQKVIINAGYLDWSWASP